MNHAALLQVLVSVLLGICFAASAKVVLIGNNITRSFHDVPASFATSIKNSGECGVLYLAQPLDACSDLTNKVEKVKNCGSSFALVIRGGCDFDEKVRRVQKAGFKAAIVYDNKEVGTLIPNRAVDGNAAGIKIHAVFISKASGQTLKKYAGLTDMELWLIPSSDYSACSIMAISFISLLAMSGVLATCFFVRKHRVRRQRRTSSRVSEFHGMSKRLVKAMPSLKFTPALDDNSCSTTSTTCAICIEDYAPGEKIRILPCRHKFHAFCVDSWLTSWRTFCPVCKRDARTRTGDPPASESTPLLSSSPASYDSSALSSLRSSIASSAAIHIGSASSRAPSFSHMQTYTSSPYVQESLRSYRQSPPISVSGSSIDLRYASSQRSHASHLMSSLGYPPISPLNARYMSPYLPSPSTTQYLRSPSNFSQSLVSSSGHHLHPLRYSESAASFSSFASAHTLPEC